MNVVFEQCDPLTLDIEVLASGIAAMPHLPEPNQVSVVISGNFVESVKSRLDDDEYGSRFSDERPDGLVGAKTVPRADGSVAVVVNAGLLMTKEVRSFTTRLFAHEGYHVVLHQSGEALPMARRASGAEGARAFFEGLAGIALEEYRIERALNDSGAWLEESYRRGFQKDLDDSATKLRDGVVLRYPDEPIDRCYQTTLTVFHALVVRLSYLTAEHLASGGQRSVESLVGAHHRWGRLVGGHWDSLLRILGPVRSAHMRTDSLLLQPAARELAEELRVWLLDIGFDFTGCAFWVRKHDF